MGRLAHSFQFAVRERARQPSLAFPASCLVLSTPTPAHASQVLASLDAAAVPLLEGVAECAAAGHLSSLHAENVRVAAAVQGGASLGAGAAATTFGLLVDPQTCEGQLCIGLGVWSHVGARRLWVYPAACS